MPIQSVPLPAPDWRHGRERPVTLPAVIDIWRIGLADATRVLSETGASGERDRARAATMVILAAYLGQPVDELRLRRPARGKPRLASPPTDLQFNLSHTRGMALLAIARGVEVGIDVERDRDVPNRLAMARRVFPAAVADELARLDDAAQNHAFLSAWTAMEARQKAFGRGIFERRVEDHDARAFGFSPAPGWLAHVAVVAASKMEFRYFDHTGS